MGSSAALISAVITGAVIALAPFAYHKTISNDLATMPQGGAFTQVPGASQPQPAIGLAIYAEKIGLAYHEGIGRPDDVIMTAILQAEVAPQNITIDKTERTTSDGVETVSTYIADLLLQERHYTVKPTQELIYGVECTADGGEISSRIVVRNLGDQISMIETSSATSDAAVNPAIPDLFCAELLESEAVAEMTRPDAQVATKPARKPVAGPKT